MTSEVFSIYKPLRTADMSSRQDSKKDTDEDITDRERWAADTTRAWQARLGLRLTPKERLKPIA